MWRVKADESRAPSGRTGAGPGKGSPGAPVPQAGNRAWRAINSPRAGGAGSAGSPPHPVLRSSRLHPVPQYPKPPLLPSPHTETGTRRPSWSPPLRPGVTSRARSAPGPEVGPLRGALTMKGGKDTPQRAEPHFHQPAAGLSHFHPAQGRLA